MRDDAQLITDTLAGDTEAFGQLVHRYQSRLFNTLFQITRNREEAEDVMQEAFVQAFVKLDSFQGNSAFYTWLYRIAFNLSISRKRKKKPEASVDQQREISGSEPVDAGELPADRLLREERAAQLHQAMTALHDEHRAVLTLREMEGFCYETIGEILDLPAGTVRSRLHRARMQLHSQLIAILHENSS